jgi:hypothetical protein
MRLKLPILMQFQPRIAVFGLFTTRLILLKSNIQLRPKHLRKPHARTETND